MTHLYEIIKILLLSIVCWSFLENRKISTQLLERVDQIKAITQTNKELILREDIDLDSFIRKKLTD